ncbi:MAG: methionine--tRNA ligase [Candidatus Nanopelagicales bacterium]
MANSFYITTPIYYVNDAPHIGHAYTTCAADLLSRWHRMRGNDVWFLTGTDEHGTKVERAAAANSVSPQQWCDNLVTNSWLPVLKTIDAANDDFIRTTDSRHKLGVQAFWQRLKDNGYVTQGKYEGPYCVGCEEFKLPGDLVIGTGEYEGKECCPIHSRPVEILQENNYFFALSKFQEELIAHYEKNPDRIQPESAYNEVMSFLKQGLQDISMSRSTVSWGIQVPWDTDQVIYVWFDALLNYATAINYAGYADGSDPKQFKRHWPAIHLVGKDILRFHAVYWPAMLLAAGLPLPRTVYAHGWLLVGGEKMSKSKLTGISPAQIVDHFGSDAFRYYFMRAINFGQDGSFSWEDISARYTAELANGLGNLASRLTAMIEKYCDSKIPAAGNYLPADQAIIDLVAVCVKRADEAINNFAIADAISSTKEIVDAVNLYVTEQAPWVLAKDSANSDRLNTVLYVIAESLRAIAVLHHPVMPKATSLLWEMIGATAIGTLSSQLISKAGDWGQLPVGAQTEKKESLFPRLAEEA